MEGCEVQAGIGSSGSTASAAGRQLRATAAVTPASTGSTWKRWASAACRNAMVRASRFEVPGPARARGRHARPTRTGARCGDPLAVLAGEGRPVAQPHAEGAPVRGERGLREEQALHLREHAGDAFALITNRPEVDQRAHAPRVATTVQALASHERVE